MKTEWKAGETWTIKDQQELQDAYDRLKPLEALPENRAVRFLEKGYPLNSFKKVYPTNKVVSKGEDILVIRKNRLYMDNGKRRSVINTDYQSKLPRDFVLPPDYTYSDHTKVHWQTERVIDYYKVLTDLQNDLVIFEESLKTLQEFGTMTRDNYEVLRQYLTAGDSETFNMGWELMFSYDYETSKEYFCLLLGQARHNWEHKTPKKSLYKTILKRVKKDFINIRYFP